jgi:hypothetical protein
LTISRRTLNSDKANVDIMHSPLFLVTIIVTLLLIGQLYPIYKYIRRWPERSKRIYIIAYCSSIILLLLDIVAFVNPGIMDSDTLLMPSTYEISMLLIPVCALIVTIYLMKRKK